MAAFTTGGTAAVAPLANEAGRVQVIGPVPVQVVPVLGVVDTSVTPAVSVSVSTAAFAADNPLLVTVML